MLARTLSIAALCGACGAVNNPTGDGSVSDAPSETPRTYHGTVPETAPVDFGGGTHCTYTMTLRQLDLQLGILASSGAVVSGQVQDLNVEAIVGTCQFIPAAPSITNYTLESAVPGAGATKLTFRERQGDKPGTSLVGDLTAVGASYQVQLTFHRNDLGPPLDWTVVVIVPLTLQAPKRL